MHGPLALPVSVVKDMGGSRLSQRKRILRSFAKAFFVPSLKRGIVPPIAWASPSREGQMAARKKLPTIGFLSISSQRFDDALRLAPFREGLKEAGYIEGRTVASEYRGAEDHNDRLPELAADLLRRQVAVIAAFGGPPAALAAKAASPTVPIVFTTAGDPVQLGLVASFNRPGGNVTGVTTFPGSVVSKQFEALHEAVPTATAIG
jgi:putative ABC transport system substrate-binding protein